MASLGKSIQSTDAASSAADAIRLATDLFGDGKFSDAEALLRKSLDKYPGNAELWNARGVMFAGMGKDFEAIQCYRKAILPNANQSGVWTNLANALTRVKHMKSAIACHRRAIETAENDALLHYNLGTSLVEAGQYGEAVASFSRAMALKPDYHLAQWNRALGYLYLGNYQQGWQDYEIRLISGQVTPRGAPGGRWHGQPYPGKRLLLVHEQGFGDSIWVARYLPRIKALGGELIVECRKELIPILKNMGIADGFIPHGEALPAADFHIHLCSLPGLFTNDVESIPTSSYLKASADRIEAMQPYFAENSERLKVGIVWSGSTTFKRNKDRAQTLIRFFQAFSLPGIQLYSLQKGPPEKELSIIPKDGTIIDMAPHIKDFGDTAGAIAQLDLVIMTDSAVAHLAGAMGKPVWVLLGKVSHWLWLLDRTDSPWYSSMRLFRPRTEGDWDHVFDLASLELMALVDAKHRR